MTLPIDSSGNIKVGLQGTSPVSGTGTFNVDRANGAAVTALALAADVTNGRTSADITKPQGAIGAVIICDCTAVTGTGAFTASGVAINGKSVNGNYTGNIIIVPNPTFNTVRLAAWYGVPLTAAPVSGSWHAAIPACVLPDTFRLVTSTTGPNASNCLTYSVEIHWIY